MLHDHSNLASSKRFLRPAATVVTKAAARLFGELRGKCENSDAFRFEGDGTKTCDSFVAKKPNKRCKKKQLGTDIKLEFFCPATCKSQCKKTDSPTSSPTVKRGACENSDSFQFEGDETKTCDSYVAEKNTQKRCDEKQPGTDKKLKFFCPSTCKKKCKETDSPTSSPTVKRGACTNLDSFQFEGDATRTCDSYVAEKPNKRCGKVQPGADKKLRFFCPATCKSKCRKTDSPTPTPTSTPTLSPTSSPTTPPSISKSSAPGLIPSVIPSLTPSGVPSSSPSFDPSGVPSSSPSGLPSNVPSVSDAHSTSAVPSSGPTATAPSKSQNPSSSPSDSPSASPSDDPSASPSDTPSTSPSVGPSGNPSASPSDDPSASPSDDPSASPSDTPSTSPSVGPSGNPSASPSDDPSASPSDTPSTSPSVGPSGNPSASPSNSPTLPPTKTPTSSPTRTICTTSSECSTGFCAIRKLTGNVCESDCQPYGCIETASNSRLDNRAYCMRSSQCKSGRCSSSSDDLSHTCEDRCGAYGCEDIGKTQLDLGEGCQGNNQCKSSKCASGKCSNVCYNTCPGLTRIARPGGRRNNQCCDSGSDCRSGLCCYSLFGCDTCEDSCGIDSVGVIAGEMKPNDRKCENNMNCASLRCSTTTIGENTCESECGAFGCEGKIVGVDLPIDATCDLSNQCESGRCSSDAFGNDTCETGCGLFGCEGVTGIGARCYRDADCESDRCAWDVDFSSGFQVGECRAKLESGDYCPMGEFGACKGDLSCKGFPGDENAFCANEDNIDFAARFADEIIGQFGRIPEAFAYFDDILGQIVPDFDSPYPFNIDVNSLDISPFGDQIDDLVDFIMGSDSYEQQRRRLREAGDEHAFQIKIFANIDYAFFLSEVVEVGIVLGTGPGPDGEKNLNAGVYISVGRGFGLDIGADVGVGIGFVFDDIDGVGGNNGCIYLEASIEGGLGLTYCGLPYFDGTTTRPKGPSEIIVSPVAGVSLGLGYIGARTFLAACTFGDDEDGEIPTGCHTYGSILNPGVVTTLDDDPC